MGEVCGAITGSIMAIGMAMGERGGQDLTNAEGVYQSVAAAKIFYQKVLEQEGSVLCRHLQARAIGRYIPMMEPTMYPKLVEANYYIKCSGRGGKVGRLGAGCMPAAPLKSDSPCRCRNPGGISCASGPGLFCAVDAFGAAGCLKSCMPGCRRNAGPS